MTVLLPDWENCGKPQIILIISSKINYLCASAARRGKSISAWFKQRERVGFVLCECVWALGVGGGGLGVMGQVGFMFQSLLASVSFCVGRVRNVRGHAAKHRVGSICGFVSPLCYLFVWWHRRSGPIWLDAGILSFVLWEIQATTCHVVIRAQPPWDGTCSIYQRQHLCNYQYFSASSTTYNFLIVRASQQRGRVHLLWSPVTTKI